MLDDLASVMKITRLVAISFSPIRNAKRDEGKEAMCDLCDDIVEGLMAGSEGLQAVPCSWLCLRVPKCMKMCESIQEGAEESTKFPCVAAGYCTEDENDKEDVYGLALTQMVCEKGPLWSCEPKQYCRRQRKGARYTCNPKPGIGRWVGMQKAASTHTAALAAGFLSQKRCGEPDAGPFCVVSPSGIGKVCEVLGGILSLLWGGYHSIVAIETPGGDDDQQWLTFWIILYLSLLLEHVFMRVLLSKFPFYYETKLILLIWLMYFDGATYVYRRLRRILAKFSPYFANMLDHRSSESAQKQLDIMIDIGGYCIRDQLAVLDKNAEQDPSRRSSAILLKKKVDKLDHLDWEYDDDDVADAAETLFVLSKWLLSSEGLQEMEERQLSRDQIALLLERAAGLVSFQPRYLNIHLIGTKDGPKGDLPVMDRNGKTDAYVKFLVRSSTTGGSRPRLSLPGKGKVYIQQGVKSRIVCKTLAPNWNEKLEVRVKGGTIESDGNYRNNEMKNKILIVEAWDADVGTWGIGLDIFQLSFLVLISSLFVGHMTGVLDSFFDARWVVIAVLSLVGLVFLGLTACYLMSVVFRADDEFIGSCEVPLEILLDQREHALSLKLYSPPVSEGRGILRVKLSLTE